MYLGTCGMVCHMYYVSHYQRYCVSHFQRYSVSHYQRYYVPVTTNKQTNKQPSPGPPASLP